MPAAPQPEAWVVWRRPRSPRGSPWEVLPGTHPTKEAALSAVNASELSAGVTEYEYTIMHPGRRPAIWPQNYLHRMMSPDRS